MQPPSNDHAPDELLLHKLNLETGQMSWTELQRYFARGVVVCVQPGMDLVQVAHKFVNDDSAAIQEWLQNGKVKRATDDEAKRWHETQAGFWAIVVTPWVLVQEQTLADSSAE